MNQILNIAGVALVSLILPSCGEAPVEYTQQKASPMNAASGSSAALPALKEAAIEREPVPNTTPPGSHMDPSSNAYIIFDGSGSMSGQPIEAAKRAVSTFVANAPEYLNIGLFVFDGRNSQGREVTPLGRGTAQRDALTSEIKAISAGGGTPLGSAILTGTNALITQFQQQLRYGDIRLIVVTDGEANDARQFSNGINAAQKYHVPIYTIGFRIKSAHALRKVSEAYFTANDEQELLIAMQETLAELDDSAASDL